MIAHYSVCTYFQVESDYQPKIESTSKGLSIHKVAKTTTLKPHTDKAERMFLTGLKEIAPSTVLFSSLVLLEKACTSAP